MSSHAFTRYSSLFYFSLFSSISNFTFNSLCVFFQFKFLFYIKLSWKPNSLSCLILSCYWSLAHETTQLYFQIVSSVYNFTLQFLMNSVQSFSFYLFKLKTQFTVLFIFLSISRLCPWDQALNFFLRVLSPWIANVIETRKLAFNII